MKLLNTKKEKGWKLPIIDCKIHGKGPAMVRCIGRYLTYDSCVSCYCEYLKMVSGNLK
jgi:hypothetical protein